MNNSVLWIRQSSWDLPCSESKPLAVPETLCGPLRWTQIGLWDDVTIGVLVQYLGWLFAFNLESFVIRLTNEHPCTIYFSLCQVAFVDLVDFQVESLSRMNLIDFLGKSSSARQINFAVFAAEKGPSLFHLPIYAKVFGRLGLNEKFPASSTLDVGDFL